jgi:hypothetical protein
MKRAFPAAILIMEILRFGVMKSEIRIPKSERIPKSKIRSGSSHQSCAAVGRCFASFLGVHGGLPNGHRRWLRASDFGLPSSFVIRHSICTIACFPKHRFMTVYSK